MTSRRIVASAIVLAAAIAAAGLAGGNGLVIATPQAGIVLVTGSGSSGGMISLQNTSSSQSFTIASFQRDASCSSTDSTTAVTAPATGVTLPPQGGQTIPIVCGGTTAQRTGMQRCLFHGVDSLMNDIVDVMGVCEYATAAGLSASPSSHDFSTVTVGASSAMTFALTNTTATAISSLSFQLDDIDGNFVIGAPCIQNGSYCDAAVALAGGGMTTFTVECTPKTSGLHGAQLYIDTDNALFLGSSSMPTTIALTCTGAAAGGPVFTLNPTSVTLSAQAGGASAASTLHVSNAGSGTTPLKITSVTIADVDPGASADWSYTATGHCAQSAIPPECDLLPGQDVDLVTTFTPTAIGSRHARMTIAYDDGTPQTATVDLYGTGLGATLQLYNSPSSIDFGIVRIGMTAQVTFRLANSGNENTSASLSIDQGPFVVMPSSAMVSPGMPVTFTASCTPNAAGPFSATLTATGSPVFGTPPVAIGLSCQGTTSALYASPSTIALGEVRTGTNPLMQSITMNSAGSQLTLAGNPTLATANANLSVGTLDQPTTPATFVLTVTPTANGSLADTIDAADTLGDTVKIPISGQVVTASYTAPSMLDLGTYCIGQPTTSSDAVLVSTGTATIGLSAPTLGAGSPFQLVPVSPPSYPAALAPGATARVSITPDRQTAAGTQVDILHWTTDVASEPTFDTHLKAQFISDGVALAPSTIDFGSVPAHTGTATQTVKIQNCKTSPITLAPQPIVLVAGSGSDPFHVVGTIPMSLAAGQSTTFSIAFQPTSVDQFTATLTIGASDGSVLTIMLIGIATGGSGGDAGAGSTPPSKSSFYACSCRAGGSGDGWLVALAVAVALRPRRRSRM